MLNFNPDEQQLLIADSLKKFLENKYSFEQRQNIIDKQQSLSPEIWSEFAQLGWLAIPFSEEAGGLGGRAADLSVVMQELGSAMVLEPYFESVVTTARILELCQHSELAQTLLAKTIAGEAKGIVATQEAKAQINWHAAEAQLVAEADGSYKLSANKHLVIHAQHADFFVLSALLDAQQVLCVVDANAKGISLDNYLLMDGRTAANVNFAEVTLEADALISQQHNAHEIMANVKQWQNIALVAETIGMMRALIEKTVAYSKTRKQFGFPISFFQALQHRMIDMDLAYEQSLSMLYRALNAYDQNSDELAIEVAAMRAYVAKAAKKIAEEAIQLHGGMGLTDELDIGHYAKRLLMINTYYGSELRHQQIFCELAYA